jgi:hypothetical protein
MSRRWAPAALGTVLAVGCGAIAAAEPPVQRTTTVAATSWGFADSATPRQNHFNPAGDLPVGADAGVSRAYYNFDLGALGRRAFTDITFVVPENGYRDCGSRALELWRTDAFTTRSTWRNRPAEHTRTATGGPGDHCNIGNPAAFDVTAAVRTALEHGKRSVTFGLRVDAAHEADPAFYRLFGGAAELRAVNNTPPDEPADLRTAGEPCAVQGGGPFANYHSSLALSARATDADPDDQVYAHFTWWPLADPARRQTQSAYASPDASVYPDLWDVPDGTYAWEVYASDGRADSAPSGPCRFTVDNTDPNAPVITSAVYPGGDPGGPAGGGPGVAGEFTFSPNGSTDVVRYGYNFDNGDSSGQVDAGADGTATVAYTPSNSGPHGVYVYAYDRAGNFSISHYSFTVRETRPTVTSAQYPPQGGPDGGVGVPGEFRFSSPLPGVVAYRYRLGDGAVAQVAAGADGTAGVTLTPRAGGEHVLHVRSVDAAGAESPERLYRFLVDTSPVVSGPTGVALGEAAEFGFRPRMPDVVSYDYWFDSDPDTTWTVGAVADGTASVSITPTDVAQRDLRVRARDAGGALSPVAALRLSVNGWRPEIDTSAASFHQGEEGTLGFTTPMPGAVEFEYWLESDAATRTRVPVAGGAATVAFTPDRVGDHRLFLRARNADGVWSTTDDATWWVTNAPDAASEEFTGVGSARAWPGEFTFTAHQPGAVAFEYSFDWSGEYQRVDVGPDRTATVSWTPEPDDELRFYTLKVRTVTAGGAVSMQTDHGFSVTSAPYVSSEEYPEGEWSGGPGVPGTFTFAPGMPGMVSYTYYVRPEFGSPGETRTVRADADGRAAVVWAPPETDRYILVVHGTTADGARSASVGYVIDVN